MNKQYKAIIFDAGGVIIDHKQHLKKLIKIFNPKDKKQFWININKYSGDLSVNKISEKEYWKIIAKLEGKNPKDIPNNLWEIDYEKLTKINKKIINLIKRLKKNYKTILISNTLKSHAKINRKRGLFDYFDDILNSCDVGLTKENPQIFYLAVKRNNLNFNECIFIDDVETFLNVASKLGIKTILFKNFNQLVNELANLGVIF
jgi:epoxide hydrolase-like predicted phosphatase